MAHREVVPEEAGRALKDLPLGHIAETLLGLCQDVLFIGWMQKEIVSHDFQDALETIRVAQ